MTCRRMACATCHEISTELVLVMRSHLRAENQLVEAKFIRTDATLAHTVNIRAAELLDQRKDIVARFKAHITQAHGTPSRELALS
jgi:hypothetical protein